MSRPVYIYALVDPRTDEIRYVGKTVKDPDLRLSEHVSAAKYGRDNCYVQNWINKLLREYETRPEVKVIEETTEEEWKEAERTWIAYFRENGSPLCNIENGGQGPGMISEETKAIISQKAKERYKDPNNHPWTGRKHSEESKKKISESRKGKKLPQAHKDTISKTQKGENNHFYGKTHTAESKKKMSEAKKGKPTFWQKGNKTEEELDVIRQKMSESLSGENNPMYGNTYTEEEKQKRREQTKESWKDPEVAQRRIKGAHNYGPRTGEYKGIVRVERKSGPKWQAFIGNEGETRYLGTYDSPEEAAVAYDIKALEEYDGDCYLNFLDESGEIADDKEIDIDPSEIRFSGGSGQQGRAASSKSGYKGVKKVKRKTGPDRWVARIKSNNLGTFDTAEEAALAYDYAALEEYGSGCYLNILSI